MGTTSMNIAQVRTGAILAVLGLLAGCGGGSSPAASGGKGGGHAGTTGVGGSVGGATGLGGTTGAAGAQGGAPGLGGAAAVGGSAGTGMAGANGGAGGTTAVGGKGGAAAGGTTSAGGAGGSTTAAGGKGGAAAGGSNGAGGAGAANQKIGIIIVEETAQTLTLPAPVGTTTIIASGGQASFGFSSGGDNCPSTTAGDCQVFECAPTTTTTPTQLKAGDVTITGLLTTPLPLKWGGISGTLTSYMSDAIASYLWTASRPATVTVTGSADVPAFTMGLTAPNPISITSPAVSGSGVSGNTYTISKAGALNVTWTGGVEGMVTVDLTTGTSASGQVNIHCALDASKGTVTIPANFMAKLGASGGFTAGVTSFADKNVGEWLMHFQASTVKDQGTATFTN
jgi:hypothetical protein